MCHDMYDILEIYSETFLFFHFQVFMALSQRNPLSVKTSLPQRDPIQTRMWLILSRLVNHQKFSVPVDVATRYTISRKALFHELFSAK